MLVGKLPTGYTRPREFVNWRCSWASLHVTGRDSLYRDCRDRFHFWVHLGPIYLSRGQMSWSFQAGRFLFDWCRLRGAFWHRRPWRRLHIRWTSGPGDDERIVTLVHPIPAGPAFMHGCRCSRHRAESDRLRSDPL